MALYNHDDLSRRSDDNNPLNRRSLSGVERVLFEGLDRDSPEYVHGLVALCMLALARRVVVLDDMAKDAVRDLDIFEWNCPYPSDLKDRGIPFFPSDLVKHTQLARLEEEMSKLRTSQAAGEPFKGTHRAEPVHPNTPTSYHTALGHLDHSKDEILDGLKRRSLRGISVPEGRMRLTDFGDLLIPLLHNKPIGIGAQVLRMVLRAEEVGGKATRRPIVEHMRDLWDVVGETHFSKPARLEAFAMHIRKLGVAMLEGQLPFERDELDVRIKRILCEGHVDTYLALSQSRSKTHQHRFQQAYSWLRGWDRGQHGSVPYASWNANAKEESFNESYKIVARSRHLSYHFFNRLRMESRTLGRELSLFREFALDNFDDVRFVRCDNVDLPPGGGTVMSGARVDSLFHGLNPDRGVLHEYQRDKDLWFADQVSAFPSATFAVLRQWVGVSADTPAFHLFGRRYYFVFDNHHFSGSYSYSYGFPAAVVEEKLRAVSYGLDEAAGAARDASVVKLSIPDLIKATREAGFNHLVIGTMSPLFGGMCNALPVGSKPVFTWEQRHHSSAWKDVYGHVHWPWLVYSFREDRGRVDDAVKGLAKADREIRAFAVAGQKQIDLLTNRYAAWKADLTPGDRHAPRMLTVAYDIYREHQLKGAAGADDEVIYIGAQERGNPVFNPMPLLNCFTLELSTRNLTFSTPLPKKGNGTGKAELAAWRKHVAPFTAFRGPKGELTEGTHELVIIGERDIKKGGL